jgi:hypothetical protein
MQNSRLKAPAAIIAFLAVSQVAFADAVSLGDGAGMVSANPVIMTHGGGGHGGGHGGGFGGSGAGFGGGPARGAMAFGGMRSYSMSYNTAPGYRAYSRTYALAGQGGFNRGRRRLREFGAQFAGFGYDYPFWYDNGSCYWNCLNSGFGPAYCSAFAYNFC